MEIRHDWKYDEVSALYDMPLLDLDPLTVKPTYQNLILQNCSYQIPEFQSLAPRIGWDLDEQRIF